MDKQIVKTSDIEINGAKADPKKLVLRLCKAVSQSEYGLDFCNGYYGKSYIPGLIDTVRDDYKCVREVIDRGKRALKSRSIRAKNRFLHWRNNDNFDKFVGYDAKQVHDANQDIRREISNAWLIEQQLKEYEPDVIVEESGNYGDCIHPVKYARIKQLLDYDYLK